MHLSNLGLINWANLPNKHYYFDGINLVTGHSGTGKTTLLDAIQTLMTAAKSGLYQYNPGQDEVSQYSRQRKGRSLASYIMGCDESRYARTDPCSGYIIGNFEPDDGEPAKPFCALIAVSAYLETTGEVRDAKLKDSTMMVIRGHHVLIDDLKYVQDQTQYIVPASKAETHLLTTRPELRDHLHPAGSKKEEYLCLLYGALRGQKLVSKIEAETAAKQLSRFMAYKKIDKIDDFVRENVLEPEETESTISQVSDLMKNIDSLQKVAEGVRTGVRRAQSALNAGVKARDLIWNEQCRFYEDNTRHLHRASLAIKELDGNIQEFSNEIKQIEVDVKQLRDQESALFFQTAQIQSQLDNIPVMAQKDALEKTIDDAQKAMVEAGKQIAVGEAARAAQLRNVTGWQHYFSQYADEWTHWMADSADRLAWQQRLAGLHQCLEQSAFNLTSWLQAPAADTVDRALLGSTESEINGLHELIEKQLDPWKEVYFRLRQVSDHKTQAVKDLAAEIERLETHQQITYNADTTRALALIRERLPAANGRILCEFIEVTDARWQLAIESIMGPRRFAIVVDPAYEEDALDIIKAERLRGTSLVQGSRAYDKRREPGGHSILHLMRFSDPLVEAYVTAAYGNVEQVHSFEALKRCARGVMMDGRSAGSFVYRVHSMTDADLVFGQQARERALRAKKHQLEQLQQDETQAGLRTRAVDQWLEYAKAVAPVTLLDPVNVALSQQQIVRQAQEALSQLDIKDFEALMKKRESLNAARGEVLDQIGHKTTRAGSLSNKQEAAQRQLDISRTQSGRLEALQDRYLSHLYELEAVHSPASVAALIDQVDAALAQEAPLFAEGEPFGTTLTKAMTLCDHEIMEFNRLNVYELKLDSTGLIIEQYKTTDFEQIQQQYAQLHGVVTDIEAVVSRLKDDVLAGCEGKLKKLSDQFNEIFVSSVCHQTYKRVESGAEKLRRLNKKLRQHIFGREHFKFEYAYVKQYKEYFEFFREVSTHNQRPADESQQGLFGEQTTLSESSQKVFKEIREKLLVDDPESARLAKGRLNEIVDYRNYRTYDIKKVFDDGHEVSLKDNAAGSGGQMETPGYVIRAAGLAAALKMEESKVALRMLMIDESFAKMDEQRSLEVINYLNSTLGFQVMFVVPSIKMGPFVPLANRQFEVVKVPLDTKRGELRSQVLVSEKVLKNPAVKSMVEQDKQRIQRECVALTFDQMLAELEANESHERDG